VRPDPLSEAATRRHELTRAKAIQALCELDRGGDPVTFADVAGIDEASSLPRCATFDEGVHNMELLAAVAESAGDKGKLVSL